MNTKTCITLAASIGLSCLSYAETGEEMNTAVFGQTNHTPNILLDVRARYEYADQDGADQSNAGTLRARVGLESQTYYGLSGLIEFEASRAADTQRYRKGGYDISGKTVIADPETTELNRLQLQYKYDGGVAIVGRQRIILDNARFIGNVGWRQNEQTFDAASYKNTMIDGLSFYYAYIDQVNRIFGDDAPGANKKYDSDSHLINATYDEVDGHTFTAYAYLLDFDNSDDNSSDTYGGSYTFKGKIADDYDFIGHAELAYQEDAGDNPFSYDALYYHLNGSVGREGYTLKGGFEVLGSDDGDFAFRTPLATGHKFNGWNDQFLTTPADGLQDLYFGIGLPVPEFPVQLVYHYFMADDGSDKYGQEIDAMVAHSFNKHTKAIAKVSYYDADDYGSDRTRFSVEMNYKY
jgi:hypothetical protein